jgi:hypothetical protein
MALVYTLQSIGLQRAIEGASMHFVAAALKDIHHIHNMSTTINLKANSA